MVNKKMKVDDVNLGNIKRIFTCLIIDPDDQCAYVGTKTGDILEINLERALFKRMGPVKRLFSQGVNCIQMLPCNDLLIGAGDGSLAKVAFKDMRLKAENKVMGAATSLALTADGTHFFVGTSKATIYWSDTEKLVPELRNTCHYEKINGIAFPHQFSDVFATCSVNDIRVWNAKTRQELLRIEVPGLECFCINFFIDGKSIISGWSDGKIRAFLPQSGKLFYAINDAHNHGVTAVASTSTCDRLVTGGMEGEVRIWKIGRQTQIMEVSLKEHRAKVADIKINNNDDQAVSSSYDGSCIVWDLKNHTRLTCLFESTMFKQVLYHPDESQLLTTGSDRKVTYWDCYDGTAIRMLDGSDSGEINALSITQQGEFFVSAGEDKYVKIWNYDQGVCLYKGLAHSGAVTRVQISPNQEFIVSVGSEGAIVLWAVPEEMRNK